MKRVLMCALVVAVLFAQEPKPVCKFIDLDGMCHDIPTRHFKNGEVLEAYGVRVTIRSEDNHSGLFEVTGIDSKRTVDRVEVTIGILESQYPSETLFLKYETFTGTAVAGLYDGVGHFFELDKIRLIRIVALKELDKQDFK